jgi:hydrogenase maturation protease
MPAPVLILAIGNESRGDDAIAPLLSRRLAAQHDGGQFEFVEDFQLQIEHATDLVGRRLVLFLDAGMDTPEPYRFRRAVNSDDRTLFSHAIAPEAVLATYSQVYRLPPPAAFVLCVRGERFELGEPPSAEAEMRMEQAMRLLQDLLKNAQEPFWESRSTTAAMQ